MPQAKMKGRERTGCHCEWSQCLRPQMLRLPGQVARKRRQRLRLLRKVTRQVPKCSAYLKSLTPTSPNGAPATKGGPATKSGTSTLPNVAPTTK